MYAFDGCTALNSVHIYDIGKWCMIDFGYKSNPLVYAHYLFLNGAKVSALSIPNTISMIKNYTFSTCTSLTSVSIPESVTSIGEYSFQDCSSLTSLTIPNTITGIGISAFSGCRHLQNINSRVTEIGQVTMGSGALYNVPSTCVLKVPIGTAGAYRQADQWNTFTNIQEVFYKSETDGDLNCDNVVNGTDVNFLVNQLLKKDVYEDVDGATDINGDGRTSGLDLNRMISIILGH